MVSSLETTVNHGILELTDDNFIEEIKQRRFLLVAFTQPDNPDSDNLFLDLSTVADIIANNDIYIGSANVEKVLKTNIYGYVYFPKLVLFHQG